ncbi:MAG: hypothetical protein HQ574_02345 [Chloroflexi bacterium]|nr:hypothetical protein [Chloroflexota bacterium]
MKKILSVFLIGFLVFILNACNSRSELPQAEEKNLAAFTTPEKTTPLINPTSTLEQSDILENHHPDGVLSLGEDTNGIRLTRIDGQVVDEWVFPGFRNSPITPSRSSRFHYGGSTDNGVIKSPCIFFSMHFGDPRILYHAGKSSLISLQEIYELIHLIGAAGKPQVVFSSLDPENVRYFNHNRFQPTPEIDGEPTLEPAVINSWLYAASLIDEPVSQILLTRSDENGFSIYPLSVNMKDDGLLGVWYTLQYEGLYGGGPIIFNGFRGLYYLDLESGQDQKIIKQDIDFLALSLDQKFVAYNSTIIPDEPRIVIQNISTGKNKQLQVLSEYDPYGAGDAHFSVSGKYLAWREVYLGEESFSSIIRIAGSAIDEVFEFDSQDLLLALNGTEADSISLAGWLDDRYLLIEVHNITDADLYILDIEDISLTFLAPGIFIGFTYP